MTAPDRPRRKPNDRALAEFEAAGLKRSAEDYRAWLMTHATEAGHMLSRVAAGRDVFSAGHSIDAATRTRIDELLAQINDAIQAGQVLKDAGAAHQARAALSARIAPADPAFQRTMAKLAAARGKAEG
jgi:hypothetical protein